MLLLALLGAQAIFPSINHTFRTILRGAPKRLRNRRSSIAPGRPVLDVPGVAKEHGLLRIPIILVVVIRAIVGAVVGVVTRGNGDVTCLLCLQWHFVGIVRVVDGIGSSGEGGIRHDGRLYLLCFVLGVGCCHVFGVGENHRVCLLRFGVNGSFYLLVNNLAYVAWYKTLQVCVQVCVQVPCKFRASSMQVPCKFRASSMQKCCMKTCNAFALHFSTEELMNFIFILSASELHENVQRKSATRFCATLLKVSR